MMPNMDGYELTRSLRAANYDLPILMVTAKDQFEDIQRGFRSGTDDYMVKPIHVKELVLRVEALLRRAKISSEKKIVVGSTVLNYDALTVTFHGQETTLPQKEFYLLYKLLSYPNKIFTRSSSWTKSGECFLKQTNAQSIHISTACGSGSGTVRIFRSSLYAG